LRAGRLRLARLIQKVGSTCEDAIRGCLLSTEQMGRKPVQVLMSSSEKSPMKHVLLVTALSSALLISTAHAAQNSFFDDLSGSWSGSGQAYVTKYGDITANCRVAITGAETKVAMNGSCGMLVFHQALGLTIKNTGGNRYVGTYTGSKTGPAKLEGTLRGDRLVMNIKWGGLVNGDRTAQMVLERTGPNSFAQTVNDTVAGKSRSTSNFAFVRR
jgi:hypothetical protein